MILHLFLLFPGPVHLDLRDAIPLVAYATTVSIILSIISDVTKKYSTRMVWKRKYPRYLDRYNQQCGGSCLKTIKTNRYLYFFKPKVKHLMKSNQNFKITITSLPALMF